MTDRPALAMISIASEGPKSARDSHATVIAELHGTARDRHLQKTIIEEWNVESIGDQVPVSRVTN